MDEATSDATSPATEAALQRRERLLQGIIAVNEALRADGEPVDAWCVRVREAATLLADTIHDHVQEAEAPDGLLGQVTHDAPALTARADALREEHPELEAAARNLIDAWPDDPDPDTLRAHVEPVVDIARQHRERGTELLMDAYGLDLSAGD